MPTLAEMFAGAPIPTLTVRVPGDVPAPTYLIQHGMTIGRARFNAIAVDHCDISPVHARIYEDKASGLVRICREQDHCAMTLPNGNEIEDVPLNDRIVFNIGDVEFRCGVVALRPMNGVVTVAPEASASDDAVIAAVPELLPYVPPLRAACPRCHESILNLPASARFCSRCGLELPENCPPWNGEGELNLSNPALAAYAHALFNLGVRYENTPGGIDLEQAIRYYEKAAKIGVPGAKARLDAREAG